MLLDKPSIHRRGFLLSAAAIGAASVCPTLFAQSNTGATAIPFYLSIHMLQGIYQFWLTPHSNAFAKASQQLVTAMKDGSVAQQKQAWQACLAPWEQLTAIAMGPVVQRKSIQTIDFTPTRPRLIKRALKSVQQPSFDMELVGAPAKGLAALEWLLWQAPQDTAGLTAYKKILAQAVADEATALHTDIVKQSPMQHPDAWNKTQTKDAFAQLYNQWIGAITRLGWVQIHKPMMQKEAGSKKAQYPREWSGNSVAAMKNQWHAIYRLGGFNAAANATIPRIAYPQDDGSDGEVTSLLTIETYLRGLGNNKLANTLAAKLSDCDQAMRAIANLPPALPLESAKPKLEAVTTSLTELKRLAEHPIATALNVSIGFSDADGD